MVAGVRQFYESDIDEIEVGGKEANYCDVIGNPNISNEKNENDPQNLKNEKILQTSRNDNIRTNCETTKQDNGISKP